jgi:hypothetical protein
MDEFDIIGCLKSIDKGIFTGQDIEDSHHHQHRNQSSGTTYRSSITLPTQTYSNGLNLHYVIESHISGSESG